MNRSLTIKLGMIALLIILLLVPLMMIDGMIGDRQARRDGVLEDIAHSSSYNQRLSGPLLIVPFRKSVLVWKTNEQTKERYQEAAQQRGFLYFLPENFELNGTINTELRSRGIYEARLYHAVNQISGHFVVPEHLGITEDFASYQFETPYLSVGISDTRGIEQIPKLKVDDKEIDFVSGSRKEWLGEGLSADLPAMDGRQVTRLNFDFELKLQGTDRFEVTLVGKSSSVKLFANWPHPSFIGNYLPANREINDTSFTANWKTSIFSTNLEEALSRCHEAAPCAELSNRSFGVSFIEPVDQYLKSDRAIKYALLFIGLTFAGFFLFEVLKNMAVHPIQYALVGVSLAFFYLLLLSMSEHIGFALAYLLSATACVSLIGFYVCHVLRSVQHGLGFTAGLAALYALLYGLLGAEDYALLMGSLLLFGLLGVFMIVTRKLDWYGVALAKPAKPVEFKIEEAVHE